nr:putative capsid protein [Picobirnavirus sp.]
MKEFKKDGVKSTKRKKFKKEKKNVREDLTNEEKESSLSANLKDTGLKNHSKYGNPDWYFTDKELAEQASRFSFQAFIGDGELVGKSELASIMAFSLNPAIGGYIGQGDSTASVNLIARKIYSRLSSTSGRTQNYGPQDVMTIILAMGEIASVISYLTRTLGLTYVYNYRNRDFPKHIIKASGVDVDDLFANLSKYRVELNTIIQLANRIPMPANISWFQKCSKLYESVFTDSPDEMAEVYLFKPATVWMMNEDEYEGGTILKTTRFTIGPGFIDTYAPRKFSEYLSVLNDMVNSIFTSTSYNIVFGDILNLSAKQDVPLLKFDLVPENYAVIPVYDPEILLHIHNANYAKMSLIVDENTLVDDDGLAASRLNDVFPDPDNNNLVYAPKFDLPYMIGAAVESTNIPRFINQCDIVDFPYGNPDLTERIEATRFSVRVDPDKIVNEGGDVPWTYRAYTLPDHYIVHSEIYTNGIQNTVFSNYINSYLIGSMDIAKLASYLEKFRYHPLLYRGANVPNLTTDVNYVLGELNYWTRLDRNWLKRLNSLCYQGLFELR